MNTTKRIYQGASDIADRPSIPNSSHELPLPAANAVLTARLCEHEKTLRILAERIAPLLRPSYPEPACEEKPATEEVTAPVVEALRCHSRHVSQMTDMVMDLLNRCEA